MVQIVTTGGPVTINDEFVSRVIGRTVDFPYTHVWGPAGSAPLEAVEDAQALVARLALTIPLARLTAPGGTAIWIKGAAVSLLRPATPFEHGTQPPFINSIAMVAGRTQSMHEDFQTAFGILTNAGAHFPGNLFNIATAHGTVEGFAHKAHEVHQQFHLW